MAFESGIRPARIEFVREATFGITPTNPAYLLFSDAVQDFTLTPTASVSPRGNVGSADIANFNVGTETHEFSVVYDLQRWFTSSTDAAFDGLSRTVDNALPASHTVLARARAGDDGTDLGGSEIFYVATGALINSVQLGGEPESGDPIVVTLNYMCEKLRSYQIDQPLATGTVTVVSSDAADTTQTLTVEDAGAAASEGLALNGLTPVVGVTSFPDIDAAFLSAETKGDITVTRTTGGSVLMVIFGSDSYDTREGDLGVPLLGSGSHASAVAGAYETILGDTIERPAATPLGIDACISSVSMTVENNIEANSCIDTIGKKLSEGSRTVTLNATLFGPTASHDAMVDHLRTVETNIVWTLTGGTLTLVGAALITLGSIARDTGLAVLSVDNTFQGKSLTIA